MKLTKQQAIEGHRKMWNWIADEIEKEQKPLYIFRLKADYCSTHDLKNPLNLCFCCEYTRGDCNKCPVDWIKSFYCYNDDDKKTLYYQVINSKSWQEQYELAKQIANLPERKATENEEI